MTSNKELVESIMSANKDIVESFTLVDTAGDDNHFSLTVISSKFTGLSLINRHRMINALLKEALKESVHALSLKTLSPEEV
jgi:stress-induced morphogen